MKILIEKEEWDNLINDDNFIIRVCEKYPKELPFEELEKWKQKMLMELCRNWLTTLKESL